MVGAVQDEANVESAAVESDHDDSATAWRLRHLRRSVLRDVTDAAMNLADSPPDRGVSHPFSFIDDAISAQVQFLTISAFDSPEELFNTTRIPYGVAYVSLSAPAGDDAVWTVQSAVTQGDVSSWVVGGNYVSTITAGHRTDVGMSYAAQRYDGGNPVALAAMGDTSRTVGAMHVFDQWSLPADLTLTTGGRFAHYGYIETGGLFSPSVELRWRRNKSQALRGFISQQMVAPGADEFVPSTVAGMWMPPQRTFSPLVSSDPFRAERTRHVELGFEQQVASVTVATRAFRQRVNEQIVTIFGLRKADAPRTDLGHYFTARAGNAEMFGWGVTVTQPVTSRIHGSLAYTVAHANWLRSPDATVYAALARSAARSQQERIHDVTATFQTNFPSTRVVAVYKLNTGYTRDDSLESRPGLGGRFDVQVNQRLPFLPLGETEWELLVAVRSLFRDSLDGSSLYDELLVVRPPKRIVGGLMIRF
jgi:hypothetical protein